MQNVDFFSFTNFYRCHNVKTAAACVFTKDTSSKDDGCLDVFFMFRNPNEKSQDFSKVEFGHYMETQVSRTKKHLKQSKYVKI